MHPSFVPPRQVLIGDAAWFAGTTPRAIRHYEQIGLLPEPERGADGRRRYGYEAMVRLLWIRRMADAGIALDDIRRAFDDPARTGAEGDQDVAAALSRLDADLAAQEAELRRKRAAVQRMRARGTRMGLLDDLVVQRLEGLPEGALSRSQLDVLLVMERMFGPLGAAIHAGRYLALAARPDLREESDRLDAAEEALDDTVSVDDPRVARVAAERYAFEKALQEFIESTDQGENDEALLARWDKAAADRQPEPIDPDTVRPDTVRPDSVRKRRRVSAFEALGRMPYDFSRARLRCMEIVEELAAREAPAR